MKNNQVGSLLKFVIVGLVSSLIASLVLLAGCTSLVYGEALPASMMLVAAVHFVSVFSGVLIATGITGVKKLIPSVLVALVETVVCVALSMLALGSATTEALSGMAASLLGAVIGWALVRTSRKGRGLRKHNAIKFCTK